jgi:hypothetical protein
VAFKTFRNIMNDYGRQLCDKAGFILWGNESWGPGPGHIDWATNYDKEISKLVELVVEDCARIGELKEQGAKGFEADQSVGWYMRQLFGVK